MLTLDEAQLMAWVSPVFWPFLRVLAVFTAAPIFSSRALPVRARIGYAFLIALAAQASLPSQPVIPLNGPEAPGAVVQQLGVGFALGFCIRILFAVFDLAGQVLGFQMGLGFAAFFDPASSAQSSAMGRFYGNLVALLFLAMNGHLLVIMGLINSFATFPVDQHFLQASRALRLQTLGTEIFASAFWIALPALTMLMFANLALGIMSRVAPQMNIFAVGFPVTATVGLLGAALSLPMMEQPIAVLMERLLEAFVRR